MAGKLDGATIGKYLALGAGAVAIPVLITGFQQANEMLTKIPMWGQELFQGITVGGIVLATLGVGIVDQLMFSR